MALNGFYRPLKSWAEDIANHRLRHVDIDDDVPRADLWPFAWNNLVGLPSAIAHLNR